MSLDKGSHDGKLLAIRDRKKKAHFEQMSIKNLLE